MPQISAAYMSMPQIYAANTSMTRVSPFENRRNEKIMSFLYLTFCSFSFEDLKFEICCTHFKNLLL